MNVEWECILDCNYSCKYCTNGRNSVLKNPIKCITDEKRLEEFIISLKKYNTEVFVFGGEPFLHPKIEFIINTFNKYNISFVIQTNFSQFKKMKELEKLTWICQVSIHRTMIQDFEILKSNLKELENKIRRIDIMYDSLECIKIYNYLKDFKNVYIAPVADFKTPKRVFLPILKEFNLNKKLFKNINFEPGNRSFVWEDQFVKGSPFKGKRCFYLNRYLLFDPEFKSYNCSHRINCEICPNDACFLMEW